MGHARAMHHPDLHENAPRSRRAKIIFAILIGIVVLATLSAMATSVLLYLKTA